MNYKEYYDKYASNALKLELNSMISGSYLSAGIGLVTMFSGNGGALLDTIIYVLLGVLVQMTKKREYVLVATICMGVNAVTSFLGGSVIGMLPLFILLMGILSLKALKELNLDYEEYVNNSEEY